MAPLIKTTIQLLLSFVQKDIPENPVHSSSHAHGDAGKLCVPSITLSTISWGYNRLDVYGVDQSTGELAHKWWDGYQWGPSAKGIELLGGGSLSNPSAVSGNTSKMDVFAVAKDGSLEHKYFDGYSWQPSVTGWDNFKGKADADFAPSTTSWAPGRLDAFFKGVDDGLYHVYYDGSSWGPSGSDNENLGGELSSGPAAVSWGPNRNDIFAIDSNNSLVHQYWDGSQWSGWETFELEADFEDETPRAVSWGVNRLDVFLITTSGSLAHVYWDGFQWSKLENLGGDSLTGTVAATASLNRLDIVALGQDSQYYHKFYDGSSWQPSVDGWYPKGGNFSTPPSIVSWVKDADQRLDIFGVDTDDHLAHQTWYGSGWYPGSSAWETLS